ncbi:MAG TPA: response regulator [Vicinamibacterales bacterium]|nr:response regulator [Vicinamibacterales bacterium]
MNANATDPDALKARIKELETLCAEVYVAAVELGFPQLLLNRLWTVAAQGRSPHAFDLEMPPRPPQPPAPVPGAASPNTTSRPSSKTEPMPIPDIKLTDRPFGARDKEPRATATLPDLKPLPARRTVMVVDDDPMMLEVLVRILQRENYELVTATGGPDALHKAGAQPVDLLITDYAMPDMKGRELAERMRERYPGIHVLYQTGFSDMLFEDRRELEDKSAFLEKPFTARGLREAARFILFGVINPAD